MNKFITTAMDHGPFKKARTKHWQKPDYSQTALRMDHFNNLGFLAK